MSKLLLPLVILAAIAAVIILSNPDLVPANFESQANQPEQIWQPSTVTGADGSTTVIQAPEMSDDTVSDLGTLDRALDSSDYALETLKSSVDHSYDTIEKIVLVMTAANSWTVSVSQVTVILVVLIIMGGLVFMFNMAMKQKNSQGNSNDANNTQVP